MMANAFPAENVAFVKDYGTYNFPIPWIAF